jgi:hypothetical protein
MLWIKRNFFLVFGGLISAGLLAFGVFYLLTSTNKNKKVEADLEQAKATLTRLYGLDPFPSKTNIAIAKEETKKLQESVKKGHQYFTPIEYPKVTGREFQTLLANTIFELHTNAQASGVVVPSKTYAFSFEAQKSLLQFAQGSFPALAEQLAEIKTICQMLFEAKVNKLVNLRRPRLTTDDPPGSNDYHELKMEKDPTTGAMSSPYIVEFQCFSPELAAALENFNKSPHGLIVRSLTVDGSAVTVAPTTPPPGTPQAPTNVVTAATETLKTVLNEKLLKIMLLVDVIKLSPTEPASRERGSGTAAAR